MSVLVASAARTASGTQNISGDLTLIDAAAFLLNVTAAATEAGDTSFTLVFPAGGRYNRLGVHGELELLWGSLGESER